MTTWCRCCHRENVPFYPGQHNICWPCLQLQNALRKYWRDLARRQLQHAETDAERMVA